MYQGNINNNNLINGYNNRVNRYNNVFSGNRMMNNNPTLNYNIQNPIFQQRLQMLKMQRMNKIKSTSDLNVDSKELANYVICPMKIEKVNNEEVVQKFDQMKSSFNTTREELWKQRTNNPYKNIIKNADYNKNFRSSKDLIIHKVTDKDCDSEKFEREFDELKSKLHKDNKELKEVIFSASKEASHKANYEFITKYKYRVKFKPKDFSDLKEAYNNERSSLEKTGTMITEVLDKYMDSDHFTSDQKKRINDALKVYNSTQLENIDRKLLTDNSSSKVSMLKKPNSRTVSSIKKKTTQPIPSVKHASKITISNKKDNTKSNKDNKEKSKNIIIVNKKKK